MPPEEIQLPPPTPEQKADFQQMYNTAIGGHATLADAVMSEYATVENVDTPTADLLKWSDADSEVRVDTRIAPTTTTTVPPYKT